MTTTQLGGVLLQYAYASPNQIFPNVVADFRSVVRMVSQERLHHSLVSALDVSTTELVKELFRHSGVHERIGILEILMARLEENSRELLANTGMLGCPPNSHALTKDMAAQLSPDVVARLMTEAANHDATLVEQIAAFYGRHPAIVARLPGPALVQIMLDLANGIVSQGAGGANADTHRKDRASES